MTDWINKFFGITNEVSVPTVISLFVFITGGIVNYLFIKIREFNDRKINRNTFYVIVKEFFKDLRKREKTIAEFYPQLSVTNENSFVVKQSIISYLDTVFEIDFKDTYYAFRKKFFWSFCNGKLKHKAFHKIWAVLSQQKYFEEQIQNSLTELRSSYNTHLANYNAHLEEYRKFNDKLMHQYPNFSAGKSEIQFAEFLDAQYQVWLNWQDLGEIRTFYYYSYTHLVSPLLEVNREYSDIRITLESSNLLLNCYLEYIEIENTINFYQKQFIMYHQLYKDNQRLLKKCLELIK